MNYKGDIKKLLTLEWKCSKKGVYEAFFEDYLLILRKQSNIVRLDIYHHHGIEHIFEPHRVLKGLYESIHKKCSSLPPTGALGRILSKL